MKHAAISADIISSTSLSLESLQELIVGIKECLGMMEKRFDGFWGRVVKGDTIECFLDNPNDALRAALILKTFVKSFNSNDCIENQKFRKCGIRLAIGIGEIRIADRNLDMLDGEAIYLSGRAVVNMKKSLNDAFKIEINDETYQGQFVVISSLINHQINKITPRQSETLFNRLQCDSDETAQIMGISLSGVNQTLNVIGWEPINLALEYFEKLKLD